MAGTHDHYSSETALWADTGIELRDTRREALRKKEDHIQANIFSGILSTQRLKRKDSHHTLLDSHLSCHRSHPRHHTSSPGVYKVCCCTGTHPGGSVYPLKHDGETREKWNE